MGGARRFQSVRLALNGATQQRCSVNHVVRHSRLGLLLAGLALIGGLWLRTRNLAQYPFWLDEAYSAFAADKGYAFIWNILPSYETHPPLYSAALRTWTLFAGDSLESYRALGVVVGMLLLPMVGLAGRELERSLGQKTWSIAFPALALAAVLPSFVDTARLVRPYYLLTLAYAGTAWALLRVARTYRETGEIDRPGWAGYLACIALLPWLHNLGLLYLASAALALLFLLGPVMFIGRHWRRYILGHAIVALAILPALLILLDQAPTWAGSTWLKFNPATLPDDIMLLFGLPGIFGVAAAALLAGYALAAHTGSRAPAALLLMALLPPALALLLTVTIAPVFLPRTLVASGAPLILLIACGANRSLATRVLFALLLISAVIRVVRVQALPPPENWYGAARWLVPKMARGDRIYAYPNEGALPLRYALRDLKMAAEVRQIPSEIPARDPSGWYATGSRGVQSLPPWRLQQIAGDATSTETPTIWLLRLAPGLYDREDRFLSILKQNRTVSAHFTENQIDIVGLRLRSAQPAPPQQPQP